MPPSHGAFQPGCGAPPSEGSSLTLEGLRQPLVLCLASRSVTFVPQAFGLLPDQIQPDQLPVDGKRSAHLGGADGAP